MTSKAFNLANLGALVFYLSVVFQIGYFSEFETSYITALSGSQIIASITYLLPWLFVFGFIYHIQYLLFFSTETRAEPDSEIWHYKLFRAGLWLETGPQAFIFMALILLLYTLFSGTGWTTFIEILVLPYLIYLAAFKVRHIGWALEAGDEPSSALLLTTALVLTFAAHSGGALSAKIFSGEECRITIDLTTDQVIFHRIVGDFALLETEYTNILLPLSQLSKLECLNPQLRRRTESTSTRGKWTDQFNDFLGNSTKAP